jgi:ubiquinone/menaquinone biosynthesis C-methylase UbiE
VLRASFSYIVIRVFNHVAIRYDAIEGVRMSKDLQAEAIHTKVKTQFSNTAQAYVTSNVHAKGNELNLLLELAGDVTDKKVLDVATGGGHTALAFAKVGANVTATDLTPTMLGAAQTFIKSQGVETINFQEAKAESLPFEHASFDIVTCRIAAHHFANPKAFVTEVTRVLKPGGMFLIVDNISPSDSDLANVMNHIEKIRDPSHVWAYSIPTWIDWLTKARLELHHLTRFKRSKNFADWTKNAQTPENVVKQLEHYVLSLPEDQQSYFEVTTKEGRLETLSHEVMVLMAKKLNVAH